MNSSSTVSHGRVSGIVVQMLFVVAMYFQCFDTGRAETGVATSAESVTAHQGFRVERLRSAKDGEGSWISMTFDPQGRLILGRDDVGIARLTFSTGQASGEAGSETVHYELIESTLRHCRGVLAANDSVYVCATDSNGFYRLRDTTGDDTYDEITRLQEFDYRSRYGHGANQLTLGPDGQIYVAIGNDVTFPTATSPASPYREPRNDLLLPNPHDAGEDDRVGFIAKTDAEGKSWQIIAGGLRNEVDVAFNADGEMFTFDADMEWDVGQPWYRPIRINHLVSGGEYGWRWGSGKWPTYYADSLPSTLDIGLGSPTGIEFGTRSNFPEAYRQALFAADWQNGRILLIQMIPDGATYRCEYQVFLEGAPLNVCDLTFGPDGAMYFITGGRGSQSGLYRVTYAGGETPLKPLLVDQSIQRQAAEARQLRRQLEAFHQRQDPSAVEFIWPHLDSLDRWIRYAARVALERQPLDAWRERALAEKRTWARIMTGLALARAGSDEDQRRLWDSQAHVEFDSLETEQLLETLRVYAVSFSRHGLPPDAQRRELAKQFEIMCPHPSPLVNQQLSELLIYLRSSQALAKTIQLLVTAVTQEEQISYAGHLSRWDGPWSDEQRQVMLQWLQQARRFRGGKLLSTMLRQIRDDFIGSMSAEESRRYESLIAQIDQPIEATEIAVARPHVRRWELAELTTAVRTLLADASPSRGRLLISQASCLRCHRLADRGTPIGPDLTNVGRRFDTTAILQSIVTPSAEIDPKYRDATYELANGQQITGRVVSVTGTELAIETNIDTGETVTIARADIENSFPAAISPMPTGLLDSFTSAEIADIIAYLQSTHGE